MTNNVDSQEEQEEILDPEIHQLLNYMVRNLGADPDRNFGAEQAEKRSPLAKFMQLSKKKSSELLIKSRLRKRRIKRNTTGQCENCLDFSADFSAFFRDISHSAIAGCPSCFVLDAGIRACISDARMLKNKQLLAYCDWTSGSQGREITRRNPKSAKQVYGVRLCIKGKGSLEQENLDELNLFGLKGWSS